MGLMLLMSLYGVNVGASEHKIKFMWYLIF